MDGRCGYVWKAFAVCGVALALGVGWGLVSQSYARGDEGAARETEEGRARAAEWVSEDAWHLFRKAQELKEQGKEEDAEELTERAENIEREARRHREREGEAREDAERARRFTSDQAHELYLRSLRLQREGKREDAHELLKRAERIEAEARESAARREQSEREERGEVGGDLHAEIRELRRDVKRLQKQVEELTALVRRLLDD